MSENKNLGQYRIGLLGGTASFALLGIVATVRLLGSIGGESDVSSLIMAVVGLTAAAALAYGALSLNNEQGRK